MKKFTFTILFSVCFVSLFAQNTDKNFFKSDKFNPHFTGVFWGVNEFVNSDGKIDYPKEAPFLEINSFRSQEVSFDFAEVPIKFNNNNGLAFGLELTLNHFSFKEKFNLNVLDHKLVASYDDLKYPNCKRFNLRTMYLQLPLLYEVQIPTENSKAYFTFGASTGLRIGSRTKQIFKDSDREKVRMKDDFETNLFRYTFVAGIGYANLQVLCKYSPSLLFKETSGPKVGVFSVGVKFDF